MHLMAEGEASKGFMIVAKRGWGEILQNQNSGFTKETIFGTWKWESREIKSGKRILCFFCYSDDEYYTDGEDGSLDYT